MYPLFDLPSVLLYFALFLTTPSRWVCLVCLDLDWTLPRRWYHLPVYLCPSLASLVRFLSSFSHTIPKSATVTSFFFFFFFFFFSFLNSQLLVVLFHSRVLNQYASSHLSREGVFLSPVARVIFSLVSSSFVTWGILKKPSCARRVPSGSFSFFYLSLN
ncbi:hypothetical protein QBC35DRAFT_149650 [Podospora australis]|uniref:Uncharacterized protein n=1 Tax=Podospora australis TaxID=1536484 RepID=A0AAN6X0H3_9PEZI|nr:hypothetical protein QBC35DRAFT_149650 [Podospora australis]